MLYDVNWRFTDEKTRPISFSFFYSTASVFLIRKMNNYSWSSAPLFLSFNWFEIFLKRRRCCNFIKLPFFYGFLTHKGWTGWWQGCREAVRVGVGRRRRRMGGGWSGIRDVQNIAVIHIFPVKIQRWSKSLEYNVQLNADFILLNSLEWRHNPLLLLLRLLSWPPDTRLNYGVFSIAY